jgi:hypothetical protein
MKSRLVIAAIILLALFSLKMGTGLLLHNLFHNVSRDHSKKAENDLNYACNCIDDFLMPFAESEVPELSQPIVYLQEFILNPACPVLSSEILFYSLRGPPALHS